MLQGIQVARLEARTPLCGHRHAMQLLSANKRFDSLIQHKQGRLESLTPTQKAELISDSNKKGGLLHLSSLM